MSDLKICRICARKDVKMFGHDRYYLLIYYKEVTGSEINSDNLPKWFCFECAALLYKFYLFKRKCHDGQNLFDELSETGFTYLDLTKLPKVSTLGSHLQILSASTNKRVKTFILHHNDYQDNKMLCNKYSNFTEVFLDDVKPEVVNSKLSIDKLLTDAVDIEPFDDFSVVDNKDVLLLTAKEPEDQAITALTDLGNESLDYKIDIEDTQLQDSDTKTTETTNQDTETPNPVTEDVIDTKSDYDINESDIILTNYESDKDDLIENKEDINKFQRSVKKKFLDENHWNKITLSDDEATRRFQSKALEPKYLKAVFKCVDCFRTFSQEDMMKRHIKLRHCVSLGPYECRHCRMRFKWKSRLHKHLKEHYTIYKCLRCELSFPVEISAFQHDYSHNGVTWTCAHCGQRFRHSSTYYTHLRKHKSKFVCTLCGVSFVSEFGLFMHKRVKHVIYEDAKEETSDTYCKVCDIKFDNKKGYDEHFAESALHATEVLEGDTSLPLKTRCTKKRVPRISTTCTSCGKTFSTYAAFTKHHLSSHPELVLPKSRKDKEDAQKQICEVCGITLASVWSLMKHLNTHRDRRATCKTCGVQLSCRAGLRRHQILTHSDDTSFVCDVCDKRFPHRSALRLHLRTHDIELSDIRFV